MAPGLSYFGFFDELGFRVGRDVSATSLPRSPSRDKEKVVAYLQAGSPLVVVPGYVTDPLDASGRTVLSGGSVLTDGEWIWPRIAAEFVDLHDVAIPEAFLWRMRGMGFAVRSLSHDETRAVFLRTNGALLVECSEDLRQALPGPRLVILDIRQSGNRIIDCIVRSDVGPIFEGHELWDISSATARANFGSIKVEKILRRDERLPQLPTGETARATLRGDNLAYLTKGAILVAVLNSRNK